MHSRSHLLIERELAQIEKANSKHIQAIPTYERSLFHWTARISGLEHTAWEGGVFKVIVLFNEYFNYHPPAIVFITIPFHPNIDPMSGRLSMDLLDDPNAWSPEISIFSLLENVRALLARPSRSYVVNSEAEDLARQDPNVYRQLVTECVAVSQRLDEPLITRSAESTEGRNHPIIEYDEAFVTAMNARESVQKPALNTAHVSFEDYFSTWSGIGTSKVTAQQKNPHLTTIEGQATLLSIHHGVKFEEIESHLTNQLEQHKSYMYGNFSKQPKQPTEIRDVKLERMEQMRKIYLSQKTPSNLTRRERTHDTLSPHPFDHFGSPLFGKSESRPIEGAVLESSPPPIAHPPAETVPAAEKESTLGIMDSTSGVAGNESASGAAEEKTAEPTHSMPGAATNESRPGVIYSSPGAATAVRPIFDAKDVPQTEITLNPSAPETVEAKENAAMNLTQETAPHDGAADAVIGESQAPAGDSLVPTVMTRETTELPPDDEVDALAEWSQNLEE